LESRRLGDDAVREIAAVRPARDGKFVRIGDALFDEMIDALEDVLDIEIVLVADEVGRELVAVAGRAAIVRAQDSLAARRHQGAAVDPVLQLEVRRRRRATVDLDDERHLVAFLVIGRQFENALDLLPAGALPRYDGELRHLPRGDLW